MLLIFGLKRYLDQLAMLTLACPRCGNPAAHGLWRRRTKLTLFFVPLIPVSTRYETHCTSCGASARVPKAEAHRLQGVG